MLLVSSSILTTDPSYCSLPRFNDVSDSESEPDADYLEDAGEGEHEEQLNPYREAFEEGYNRAEDEMELTTAGRKREES